MRVSEIRVTEIRDAKIREKPVRVAVYEEWRHSLQRGTSAIGNLSLSLRLAIAYEIPDISYLNSGMTKSKIYEYRSFQRVNLYF